MGVRMRGISRIGEKIRQSRRCRPAENDIKEKANYAPTRFDVTEDRWGHEGEALMATTSTIAREYGNMSQRSHIWYPERGGREEEYKCEALPLGERYAGISE